MYSNTYAAYSRKRISIDNACIPENTRDTLPLNKRKTKKPLPVKKLAPYLFFSPHHTAIFSVVCNYLTLRRKR